MRFILGIIFLVVVLISLFLIKITPDKTKMALMLTTVIALVAFAGSLFSVYKSYLKSFDVSALVNTKVVLQQAGFAYEDEVFFAPLISMGFVFLSEGSKTVSIELLALKLVNKTTNEMKWFHVANEVESISGGDKQFAIKNTREEIGALVLVQGVPQSRKLAFVETADVTLLTGVDDYGKLWKKFTKGNYEANLYAGRAGRKKLVKIGNFHFSLLEDVNVLGNQTKFFYPDEIVNRLSTGK